MTSWEGVRIVMPSKAIAQALVRACPPGCCTQALTEARGCGQITRSDLDQLAENLETRGA